MERASPVRDYTNKAARQRDRFLTSRDGSLDQSAMIWCADDWSHVLQRRDCQDLNGETDILFLRDGGVKKIAINLT